MKKKAVLGLDTAKLFIIAILALVIVSVVVLIVLDELDDIQPNAFGGTLANTTTSTVVNVTYVTYPTGLSSSSPDCILTISAATNASTGDLIPTTNYTIDGCSISCPSTAASCYKYNNSLWNISGTYTTSSQSKVMVYNTSGAISEFFEETGTWFTLIGIIIIILIIAVVIVVINRFGTGGGAFSGTPQTANI